MPPRRMRNAGNAQIKEQLSRDMRQSRLALFIQQFEKEAQERMNDLEARLENMLATMDRVFKVELMKMPPSLQNTLIGDLISGKSTDQSPGTQCTPAQRSSSKTSKGGKGAKKTRILTGSNSTGNLRGSSVTTKRTLSRVTKTNDQTKPKLRSVVSTGDLHCSMAGSAAHITVTTALGQTVSFSEETKDEINLDLLDDVAWCQIQKLTVILSSGSFLEQST
ncbi:Borealin-2 [Nibea albiflora]|uniref:Borealin-2 n=1 Tax=Nibea albiflora TaxID=240163 RepID=A0ACB7EVR6_NIBAL|nr:Borealin-2 [Nibea albiflora]